MNQELRIRDATAADAAVVVDFNARLALESENKVLDLALLRPGVERLLADPAKGRYFVAEADGAVVGQLAVTFEWSDWRNGWFWWIQSVYVAPEQRRRGVFGSLYRHIEAAAQAQGDVIGIRLYVEEDNAPAHATYLKHGLEWTSYRVMERHPLG